MNPAIVTNLVSLGIVVIGTVVWSVRQEGRITQVDQKTDGIKELISSQFNDLKELMRVQQGSTNQRLERIERGMNGHLPKD